MHEEVGVLGPETPLAELLLELLHRFDHPRIAAAQVLFALGDVAPHPGQRIGAVVRQVEVSDADGRLEVGQREDPLGRKARRVGVPEEDGVDGARVFVHEALEVEDVGVVLGRPDADVVQRGGVAEVVLGGVGVGVEHEGRAVDLARLLGGLVEEVVEVRVDAEQHLLRRTGYHAHEHLLALREVGAVGHRYLEAQEGVLEVVEDPAPEGHVLIPLDIDVHQPLCRVGGRQRARQLCVGGRSREGIPSAQFFAQVGSHT